MLTVVSSADHKAMLAYSSRGVVETFGDRVDAVCRIGAFVTPFFLCEDRLSVPGLVPRALHDDATLLDP